MNILCLFTNVLVNHYCSSNLQSLCSRERQERRPSGRPIILIYHDNLSVNNGIRTLITSLILIIYKRNLCLLPPLTF